MILFWKKTTAKGVIASISVGLISALTLILLSQKTFNEVYNLSGVVAPIQINNPAVFSVPISFIVLIIVSLFTQPKNKPAITEGEEAKEGDGEDKKVCSTGV
jgi:cation/acetate symporter